VADLTPEERALLRALDAARRQRMAEHGASPEWYVGSTQDVTGSGGGDPCVAILVRCEVGGPHEGPGIVADFLGDSDKARADAGMMCAAVNALRSLLDALDAAEREIAAAERVVEAAREVAEDHAAGEEYRLCGCCVCAALRALDGKEEVRR